MSENQTLLHTVAQSGEYNEKTDKPWKQSKMTPKRIPKHTQRLLIPRCAMETSSRRFAILELRDLQEGKYEEEKRMKVRRKEIYILRSSTLKPALTKNTCANFRGFEVAVCTDHVL